MADQIKIAVRVRPFAPHEKGQDCIIDMEGNDTTLIDPSGGESKEFHFSKSFWSHDDDKGGRITNTHLFEDLGNEVLTNAYEGYNGTIFAYGQTGSGKSYSVEGCPEDPGLLQRITEALFERKKTHEEADTENQLKVTCSYLEIYNEKLRDLLDPSEKKLKVYATKKQGVFVKNLQTVLCESYDDILQLLKDGKKLRIVASTKMNAQSSRSHAIFTIHYEEKRVEGTKKKIIKSKINIVDLAGSERANKTGATGARLKEGSNINKSLTYLGLVIQKLVENSKGKKEFIPYRNSELTNLLQESLGGNSKTIMIAAISPAAFNHEETLSTLRFAQSVSAISNKTSSNVDEEASSIARMIEEIRELKKAIEEKKKRLADGIEDDEEDDELAALQEMIAQKEKEVMGDDDIEQAREKRKQLQKARTIMLRENGLDDGEIKEMFKQDPDAIQLINISNDASMANCLIYFLKDGDNKMGSKKGNTITMTGLGIGENHATLSTNGFNTMHVTPVDPKKNTVLVNGNQITEKTEVNHLDRLVFGTLGNAFKVVIPKQKVEGEEEEQKVSDYDAVLQDRLNSDTKEAANLRKYIEELRERIGEEKTSVFVRQLQQILQALDEANEYTKARYVAFPLDRHYVRFSLEIMIDILTYDNDDPEIAVRCRHSKTDEVLFLWSEEKFYERLELMREWYADLMDDGIINREHAIDPWSDITDDDVKKRESDRDTALKDRLA